MDAGKARSRSRLRFRALEPLTHFARGSSEAWQNEGSSRKRVDAAILGVRRWFGPARELYVRVGWGLLPVCTFARALLLGIRRPSGRRTSRSCAVQFGPKALQAGLVCRLV